MTSFQSSLNATFNAFLFATVCEGRDEMPVSVLSALAWLDLDPWAEAAELASMPAVGAAERLSSLLAGVTGGPAAQPDRESMAARLVGLLPTPVGTDVKLGARAAAVRTSPYIQSLGIMWLIVLAAMAVSAWIGAQPPVAGAHGSGSRPAVAATLGH